MIRRTALITGGAKGIGKMTAMALAASGVNVAINYRNSERQAKELAASINEQYNVRAASFKGDISNHEDCRGLVEDILEIFPSIDILVHNAGPYVKERKSVDEYDVDQWQYIINGNLNSVFYLTKEILPIMRKRNWGRIITYGFDRVDTAPGWIYRSAFAAAKTAVASLTKTIALEEAANGITANMVCPGDIIGEWKEKRIEDAQETNDQTTPVGRPGTGDDVARVISFLCEDQSSFLTGSVIPITGAKDVLGKVFYQD
ncbi:SDR family oxidoreductase [Falsibacillus albus]|uniref:SDR family oxidoreductase n=1 Tax=Falsibacillus albus TaxID=2478915 RepID=A0A3L7JY44_9BACI|nr:SDR family oxidoreductase [Falsibacillus albus]RLQ95215.1 SDR family oxidoreductase [Falsibacillus albus]